MPSALSAAQRVPSALSAEAFQLRAQASCPARPEGRGGHAVLPTVAMQFCPQWPCSSAHSGPSCSSVRGSEPSEFARRRVASLSAQGVALCCDQGPYDVASLSAQVVTLCCNRIHFGPLLHTLHEFACCYFKLTFLQACSVGLGFPMSESQDVSSARIKSHEI